MADRIYTDTSVIGGCEDEEFCVHSRRLIDAFVHGDLRLVISELTLRELETAPSAVRNVLRAIPGVDIEVLQLTQAAAELAKRYISDGVLPNEMLADAQHIAMASVARVDALVSWNFRHIVNLHRIHGYHAVNLRYGYPALEIRTPREVLGDE